MDRIVLDVDNTIAFDGGKLGYENARPNKAVIDKIAALRSDGIKIILYTSRNMRSYQNNTGEITAKTLPILMDWLKRHGVSYDEIWVGKPWCGHEGYYVDDRAIRPSEFVTKTEAEIQALLAAEKKASEGFCQ